jgi:hypothetical protein
MYSWYINKHFDITVKLMYKFSSVHITNDVEWQYENSKYQFA